MSLLPVGFGASGDDYEITDSLRLRSSADAHLSRTNAANGNRKTFTISFWIKRANISIDQMRILNSNFGNDGIFDLYFEDLK